MTTDHVHEHADDWHLLDPIHVAGGGALAAEQRGRNGVVTRIDVARDLVEIRVVTYLWVSPTELEER